MTNRLLNKIAHITGASRGIGKSIAEIFSNEGASAIIISDIDDEEGERLAKILGNNTHYLHLDVTKEEEWIRIAKKIENKFGRLDILINNAGINGLKDERGRQNPEHCSLETWRHVNAVNSEGVFLGCKYTIPVMKNNKTSSIVNICSRSGLVGVPNMVAYAASKSAVRNYTKSVALYCAQNNYNIRCNSIHPAAILTQMWDSIFGADRENKIKQYSEEIPLKRMGRPEDIAYAALYLASDESSFVTGSEIIIDGGILAGAGACPKSH